MSHILIQNKGEVPLWGIRLLGRSDKDESKIGQFGTGLKETLALLARYDRLPIVFAGTNRLDFSIQTIDGQAELCFMQSEGTDRFPADCWHGLGISPQYGQKDWQDRWMAFRELFCNAQDAEGLFHDVVSGEPTGVAGATRIYLPVDPQMLTAYTACYDRLLFLQQRDTVQMVSSVGRAMPKRRPDEKIQIYHRGVWIQEGKIRSLFDYELDDLHLNECRTADWWSVNWELGRIVAGFSREQAAKVIAARNDTEPVYEMTVLERAKDIVSDDEDWREAWESLYGEKAVATTADGHLYERLKAAGWVPIVVTNQNLFDLLKRAGVRTVVDVLSEQDQTYEWVHPPELGTQTIFDGIWQALESRGLSRGKPKPSVLVFKERPGSTETTLGSYDDGVCYINEAVVGSQQERWACVEELAHHISGSPDCSRALQLFYDQVVAEILYGK